MCATCYRLPMQGAASEAGTVNSDLTFDSDEFDSLEDNITIYLQVLFSIIIIVANFSYYSYTHMCIISYQS